MTTRNRLKNSASFMHLSTIPQNPDAAAQPAQPAAAAPDTTPDPAAGPQATAPETKVEDVRDTDGEDDDDDDDEDEDDDDEKADDEEVKKAIGGGQRAAVRAARRVERRRCAAIFGSKHAAGRVPLAAQLAFGTNMKASAAVKVLASAAQESAANPLAAAMAALPRHNVGHGGGAQPGVETPDQKLLASAAARAKTAKK